MPKNPMSPDEVALLWQLYGQGEIVSIIARRMNPPFPSVNERVLNAGGIRPLVAQRPARALSAAEREEISRGLAAGASLRCIARGLARPASTVSREVARNGGRRCYRAAAAGTVRGAAPAPTQAVEAGHLSRVASGGGRQACVGVVS